MQQIVHPVKVEDPILDSYQVKPVHCVQGGQTITYKRENASSHSATQSSFSFYTPNPKAILSRRFVFRAKVRVQLAGADAGSLLFQTGKEGFKQFPLSAIMSTVQLTLNNSSMSVNLADIIHPMQLFNDCSYENQHRALSSTPSMRDYYQVYEDGVGGVKNPLSKWGDNSYEPTRGSFTPISVSVNTNTAYDAIYELAVPLMISPLQFNEEDDKDGLLYVKSVSLNINYVSNLFQRMWARASSANPITSGSVEILSDPELLLKYVTPPDNYVYPQQAVYDYYNVSRHITRAQGGTLASNASRTIITDNLQLHSIPYKILVWVRRPDATIDETKSNAYFRIDNISLQFNNFSGLLSTATTQDLYNMSKSNGLDVSYQDWFGVTRDNNGLTASAKGLIGSVLCMEPGYDIPLRKGEAPGQVGNFNFQLQMQVTNVNQAEAIEPEIYVCILNKGVLVNGQDGIITQYAAILSEADVLMAQKSPMVQYKKKSNMYGGSFFLNPKSILRDLARGPKVIDALLKGDIKEVGRQYKERFVEEAKAIPGDIKEAMGLAKKLIEMTQGGAVVGGMKGGRKLTKKQVLNRLRKM